MSKTLLLCGAAALLAGAPAYGAVVISGAATHNMNCASGVCTATAANAALNAGDLQTMLASGDVTVATGSLASDIKVTLPFNWPGTSRLTLDAKRSIQVNKPVQVLGTGALTLTTNDGGTGGDLSFEGPGHVEFWDLSSNLVVNAQSYTLIGDVASLASAVSANPSGSYALAKSYNAASDGTYALPPVQTTFAGNFEGLGNTISRLKIKINLRSTPVNAGLFSALGSGSLVRDLNLAKASVSVHLRGHGAGTQGTGVLAGISDGEIARVRADGSINSNITFNGGIGGLVGTMFSGVVRDSRADVAVAAHALKGTAFAGGLVGTAEDGSVLRSAATGTVSSSADTYSATAGGLIGSVNHASTAQSWASGSATAAGDDDGYAGGLIGSNTRGNVTDSYATGNAVATAATHSAYAGGFAGASWSASNSTVTSYSTGTAASTAGFGSFHGGFMGDNAAGATGDYWDLDSSGTTNGVGSGSSSGMTGLSDAALRSSVPSGFNPAVWAQSATVNGGYPYLIANPPP